jgi:hypothetical protein
MVEAFLGWDVGAWHCDRNQKSRDALCALSLGNGGRPVLAGQPWRGNLRQALAREGSDPIAEMLRLAQVDPLGIGGVTVAIDAALGWPNAFRNLLIRGEVSEVIGETPFENKLLYRETDRVLKQNGHRPLSVVQDMISSQSTKAIVFLKRAGLVRTEPGIWRSADGTKPQVTAIETYPTPCQVHEAFAESCAEISSCEGFIKVCGKREHVEKDVRDSLYCALVAFAFATDREQLLSPEEAGSEIPLEEGWIWIPKQCYPQWLAENGTPG